MRVSFLLFLLPLLSSALTTRSTDVGPSSNPAVVSQEAQQLVDGLCANMTARWQVLDANCDPNAIFALTYIYMTYGVKVFLVNDYFDDGCAMANFTFHFASRYMAAFDAYAAGNFADVSGPWMSAFNWAKSGHSNATENLLLGMNAHINYDLAIATYEDGYTSLERKPDYDRVNDLLGWVMYNVSVDLGQRYDPILSPNSLDSPILDIIIGWREGAWGAAVGYASLFLLTDILEAANDVGVTIAAVLFQPLRFENTTAWRVAYCEANHAPSMLN